jgi:hypothetical protein|tara:strand:- start:868 stop:1332 length:465 start_codon:yes stop_codon:yes gene_type:complete
MGCLGEYEEAIFRRLYGLLPEDELKEDCSDSQCLIYTGKDAIIPLYNIGYCDPTRMGSMNYGNPIRDLFMTDHEGYHECGAQWLREREVAECTPNVREMIHILDALGTMAKLEEECPRCIEMFGKIMKGAKPFYKEDPQKMQEFLVQRDKNIFG